MTKITLGSDPELHLFDHERGRIVSSIPVLKTDKHDPILLPGEVRLYADNVLSEIAHPPVFTSDEAVAKFRDIFSLVRDYLGRRYSLVAQAAHTYDAEEVSHPKAREAGCNPNFDCYREEENPKLEFTDGMRTGSFHVHLGHEKLVTMTDKANAAKLMDVYVGCASILFDKDPTALARRKYYGRAGEFRPTDYGVEWRVLGNFPLRTPEMTKLVFDLVMWATSHIDNGTMLDVLKMNGIQHDTQLAINTCDASLARHVLVNAGLPHTLMSRAEREYATPAMEIAWGIN